MTGQKWRQAILLCKVSGLAVGGAIAGYAFGHFIDWAATSFYIDKRWATVMVVLLIGGPLAFFGVPFEQTILDSDLRSVGIRGRLRQSFAPFIFCFLVATVAQIGKIAA